MNYLIAGGGTGGHIYPAVAIGESLLAKVEHAAVYFVGTRYGMEKDIIPKLGYPLLTLPMRGLLGKSLAQKAALLWRIPASLLLSLFLLIKYRPGVVIGVGGYASAPLVLTAGLLRIPVLIQEQNAFPGVTNKFAARFAKLACLGFAEAGTHLPCPSITTGNPVRGGFFSKREAWTPDRRIVLVLGGSQGARALNQILPDLLKQHVPGDAGLKIIHQCGRAHAHSVKAAYGDQVPFELEITPFIDNLDQLMQKVLMVVCRAGASTIAELKLVGVPAVLIPFPNATHDHQTFNAKSLAALGAARLIPEQDLPQAGEVLADLLSDRDQLARMAAAYPTQNRSAADTCADIALALEQKKEVPHIVQSHGTHVSSH